MERGGPQKAFVGALGAGRGWSWTPKTTGVENCLTGCLLAPHKLHEGAGEVRGSRLQMWLTMAGAGGFSLQGLSPLPLAAQMVY